MSTALALLEDALSLTNAVGVDQTLTADEAADGLRAFNRLLDEWSTQNLAVFGQANQTFNTVASQGTYTIGVGGNWVTARPIRINGGYSTVNGSSYQMTSMTQGEYNAIPVKTQTQEFPDRYLYVNENPLGLITLWPIPSAITPITWSIDRVLTQLATLTTTLVFPPGYESAFVPALAMKLAPMFGKRIAEFPDIVADAAKALGNIKRGNKKVYLMRCDPSFSDSPSNSGWWSF